MSESWKRNSGSSRRTFLRTTAGVAAGTMLTQGPLSAQIDRTITAGATGSHPTGSQLAFPKIDPRLMITPDQAWDWNMFKAQCGPTYAGSAGWKRFTDLLVSKMSEFGAVDVDHVEIPYDHYIVEDWPDRRTHVHDSGMAIEKLVTDGTPVPVVASYGMTSGFTPPEGVTAGMVYYDRSRPPAAADIAGKILVFQTAPYPDPPYSEAFLDNFTLTDYEWRSPGKWAPLFVPPPRASPAPIMAAGSGVSSTGLPRSALPGAQRASWWFTTCRRARRSVSPNEASTRRTERQASERPTSTAPPSRSIA
jgi:hypothetical protein